MSSRSAADDVVQDAFVRSICPPQLRSQPTAQAGLFTIAANKARDHLRGRTRRREVPLDAQVGGADAEGQRFLDLLADDESDPSEQMTVEEREALVRAVIEEMPPNLAEVLVLAYFHHFAYRDIAEVLDIPLGTVKSRLHSAVNQFGARFRARTKEQEPDAPS
ncbi:MAG: sigma-70 family RNA polymerase sigma factor [Phycisphaerales bacterium]|nr:sigma-70 family RNA polymerase sigma factor [Phycisphaerales bacterium]